MYYMYGIYGIIWENVASYNKIPGSQGEINNIRTLLKVKKYYFFQEDGY